MTPEDQERIRLFDRRLQNGIQIGLVETADPRSARLAAFCAALSGLIPRLQVAAVAGDLTGLPGIAVGCRFQFHEVPEGPALPLHLGAMAVMETLAETHPRLAGGVLPPLWERFGAAQTAVKGDILYLIGEVGDGRWEPVLAVIAGSPGDGEVRAAAAEALAKVRGR
jgi:hypothetical protein